MPRTKLEIPNSFIFECKLPVLISHINYGNHLGNDSLLSIIHEARIQFLNSVGFSEIDIGSGTGLILTEAILLFKNQAFHKDILKIQIAISGQTRMSFDILYLVTRTSDNKEIARVKTSMLAFDYKANKISVLPEIFTGKFQ